VGLGGATSSVRTLDLLSTISSADRSVHRALALRNPRLRDRRTFYGKRRLHALPTPSLIMTVPLARQRAGTFMALSSLAYYLGNKSISVLAQEQEIDEPNQYKVMSVPSSAPRKE